MSSAPVTFDSIKAFIAARTGISPPSAGEDPVILGAGLVDSFGLVTLLADVESKFGVFPDLMRYDPSSFSTLNGLAEIIATSLEERGSSVQRQDAAQPQQVQAGECRIERLDSGHPCWPQLPGLFKEMFVHFDHSGVRLPLVAGGEKLWHQAIEKLPARSFYVAGAVTDGQLKGFITGHMKMLPAYLGGGMAGEVSYVFIDPSARRKRLAQLLFDAAQAWFQEQGAQSIEAQVLCKNDSAIHFWESLAFERELLQFRKRLAPVR